VSGELFVELEEIRLANGMFRWAPKDILKPRELTPVEKIALEKKDALLTEKSETRQEMCWRCGERKAYVWVREVGFDFKGDKADPVKHVAITTADYPGAVPGFCHFCIGFAPAELAEAVYFDRPEMYWGVRPTRWFVSFTDGTRQGDRIVTIDPKQELPTIIEEFSGKNQED
jgi:hypothetical protein